MAATQAGEAPGAGSKTYDPFDAFRQMRDTYLDAMSKSMVEVVNTEAYAKSTGALLESTLTMAAPMREAMDKSMQQALQQLSLPSREDLVRLAERFTNLEMRLDDLDARFDRLQAGMERAAASLPEHLSRIMEALDALGHRSKAAAAEPIEAEPAATPVAEAGLTPLAMPPAEDTPQALSPIAAAPEEVADVDMTPADLAQEEFPENPSSTEAEETLPSTVSALIEDEDIASAAELPASDGDIGSEALPAHVPATAQALTRAVRAGGHKRKKVRLAAQA